MGGGAGRRRKNVHPCFPPLKAKHLRLETCDSCGAGGWAACAAAGVWGGWAAPYGLCCRGCLEVGCWVGGVVRFSYTARPPPPVILPGAAFAALCLAGAKAPGFAVPARAAACFLGRLLVLSPYGGARKKARYGAESTSQVPICKTATTPDWRARRGEACVVQAPKCNRPHLQAEPFDAAPCRAFFRAPLALSAQAPCDGAHLVELPVEVSCRVALDVAPVTCDV